MNLMISMIRQTVYAYLDLPYHEQVALWRKIGWNGWITSDPQRETRNKEFFSWVVANKKTDELINLLK